VPVGLQRVCLVSSARAFALRLALTATPVLLAEHCREEQTPAERIVEANCYDVCSQKRDLVSSVLWRSVQQQTTPTKGGGCFDLLFALLLPVWFFFGGLRVFGWWWSGVVI